MARLNLTLFNVFLDRRLSNSVLSVGHTWPQALSALFGAAGTPEYVLKEFWLKRKEHFKQLEPSFYSIQGLRLSNLVLRLFQAM